MTRRKKLTKEDCEEIAKLIEEGHQIKDLARNYNVDRSTIYNRCKYLYESKKIPVETRNKVIKAIKEGYTKAEAAQLYGLNIGTVYNLTRGIEGYKSQGNHILRKNGIKLLNRLMTDGYLISDFNVPVVRNLQQKFPIIRSARYKDKTFFYLPGREEETIEAFFREKPDRIISYSAIEEMSYLLGVKISNKDQRKLLERYKKKHDDYWRSRHLIQRSIDDWVDDSIPSETSFRLMLKI
ncbi:MAG: helix-turn-helix domain-containing protein [Thermoplasmatales archaeon]|nr:helix-turn-helix domain-containing protein [Thermoplasmatales archaeon]